MHLFLLLKPVSRHGFHGRHRARINRQNDDEEEFDHTQDEETEPEVLPSLRD
jgi:hypothetical protein